MFEPAQAMGGLMTSDLINSENISKERLKELYDAAFMHTSFDDDGDLMVNDGGYFCFAFPAEGTVRLMAIFRTNPSLKPQRLLEFANRINQEFIMVRATIASNSAVVIDYYLLLEGGMTPRSIVSATKRLLQVTTQAISEHGDGIIG